MVADVLADDSGFVTCSCLLKPRDKGNWTIKRIEKAYDDGQLLLSSVPFDAIVSFNPKHITYSEAVTTSVEQILIESSINNLKRKLKVINPSIDVSAIEYQMIYFENIKKYVHVLEESIEKNPYISLKIELINSDEIDFKKYNGYDIPRLQNLKLLNKKNERRSR
jgi:hypothetical protein